LNDVKRKINLLPLLVVYFLIFLGVWFAIKLSFESYLYSFSGEVIGGLLNALLKIIIWILPSIYFVKKYADILEYTLDDLFAKKPVLTGEVWFLAALVLLPTLIKFFENGKINVNDNFKFTDLIWIAIVGLTEEMVFRGWLQNAFISTLKTVVGSFAVTNILFVIIHIPIQVKNGTFPDFGHFLMIFVLGIMFSYLFRITKSLWIPIIFHTIWDLLVTCF